MKYRNPWRSIRLKMCIFAALILGGILFCYSYYLFVELQSVLSRNLDAELKVKALELAKTIKAFQETKSPGGDIHYAAIKVLDFDIDYDQKQELSIADRQWFRLIDRYALDKDYIVVRALDGDILASSRAIPSEVQYTVNGIFKKYPHVQSIWNTFFYEKKEFRTLQMTMLARDRPHYYIQISTPFVTVSQFLEGRLWAIAIGMIVVVLSFSLFGFLLVNQILRPVRKIAETARSMTHEDLSRRVEVTEVDMEMSFLVSAFNSMMERLETAFKHMAGMTAQIAHELKTPLSVIKGEGQMALRRNLSSEEFRAVIESGISETEKMLRVIDDLLTAANIAYDKEIFQLEDIDLVMFLQDILQKSQILAEPRGIHMELRVPEPTLSITGDRVHLRRLFFNLIDNAIEHSRPGSTVLISAVREGECVIIAVQDEGDGIAEEHLPYVFDRTFKKIKKNKMHDENRARSGLGLYLCRVIAEAHSGEISVQSTIGKGSIFSLRIPVRPARKKY
jgi:signal transduction histidine kinase